MDYKLSFTPTIFATAGEALEAALKFDGFTARPYQYEIRAKIIDPDTPAEFVGYIVRVSDLAGSGVGALEFTAWPVK